MNSVLKYKRMQGKFGLPKLHELKTTFKIEINNEGEIFDQIRSEVSERIFSFSDRIIEPVISGSESLCCMYEENMITNEERGQLFELYRKIQELRWENNMLMVKPDEKQTAAWIRKTWSLWNDEMGGTLETLCKKMSTSWRKLRVSEEKNVHYHE